jgi:hypothetical protein
MNELRYLPLILLLGKGGNEFAERRCLCIGESLHRARTDREPNGRVEQWMLELAEASSRTEVGNGNPKDLRRQPSDFELGLG